MKASIALLAAALTGCVQYNVADGDGVPRARIGQTVEIGDFELTPLAVLEDSRCPSDVQCVWAGQLRLSVRIDFDDSVGTRELTLGKAQHVGTGMLTLTEAEPYPKAGKPIYPEDYRFGFSYAPDVMN